MYRSMKFHEVIQHHSKDRFELRWVTEPCPGEIPTGGFRVMLIDDDKFEHVKARQQLEEAEYVSKAEPQSPLSDGLVTIRGEIDQN